MNDWSIRKIVVIVSSNFMLKCLYSSAKQDGSRTVSDESSNWGRTSILWKLPSEFELNVSKWFVKAFLLGGQRTEILHSLQMNDRQRRINRIAQALIDEHVVDDDENCQGDDDFESINSVSESSYNSSSTGSEEEEAQAEQERVTTKLNA